MKRSLATTLAAVASAPLVLLSVGTAAPAQAALACDTPYPAGSAYRVSISPANVSIKSGSQTFLYTRVFRGETGCSDQVVRFWRRAAGQTTYFPVGYSVTGTADLGAGFVQRSVTPTRSFRWFIQFRNINTASALVSVTR